MEVLLDYIYNLNWFAVVTAAAAGMLVSAAWYSDKLFGKTWMKAVGLKKKDTEKPGVTLALVISFITLLVSSAALAVLVDVLMVTGALNGVLLGVLVGFGFMVMNSGMHKLYEQRPFTLFAITAVGDLLTLAAIGAILAVW
jgi:hypothetical protein